jgi:hypothetical protein
MDSTITIMNGTEWNSLEIVKLLISILTPIVVAFIAYRFSKLTKNIEKIHWTNNKIIEKRIDVYDSIVPKLNDLMCFYCYIGNWKEKDPDSIIDLKRSLDKEIHIYAPLFSQDLVKSYDKFISLCFETFTGWGNDAKIKSLFVRRKENHKKWKEQWEDRFSKKEKVSDPNNIRTAYFELMDVFKKDLEIFKTGQFLFSDIPNANIK